MKEKKIISYLKNNILLNLYHKKNITKFTYILHFLTISTLN